MMTKKTCVALAVAAVALAGLVAAPAADALPIECSCDLCFEVPYYATCHLPWNNEVINCQSFVVLFCPVEYGVEPAAASPSPSWAPTKSSPSETSASQPRRASGSSLSQEGLLRWGDSPSENCANQERRDSRN